MNVPAEVKQSDSQQILHTPSGNNYDELPFTDEDVKVVLAALQPFPGALASSEASAFSSRPTRYSALTPTVSEPPQPSAWPLAFLRLAHVPRRWHTLPLRHCW